MNQNTVSIHSVNVALHGVRTLDIEFLKKEPMQLLIEPTDSNTLTLRVRELLKGHIATEMPTLKEIAEQIHLSPKTLHRRLSDEGNSYQKVKDGLRRDMAIYLLGVQQLTIIDVAEQIGFSDTCTFHRAFKKWTGVTPGLYKQTHHGNLTR